jgi:hypothetical protein
MKALLIDVNFTTGERAGGRFKKSRNTPCTPTWQTNPPRGKGKEIRLVLDENVDPYRGVEGITVLEDEAEIEAALAANFPEVEYGKVTNETLYRASLDDAVKRGSIAVRELPADSREQLKVLADRPDIRGLEKRVMRRATCREVMRNPHPGTK